MSAFSAIVQSNAIHVMADSLAYDSEGNPVQIDCRKAHVIGDLKAIVVNTGPALLSEFMANVFADVFSTFDDLKDRLQPTVKDTFEAYAERFCDGDAFANVMIAGLHEGTGKLAMYAIDCATFGERYAQILKNSDKPENVEDQIDPFTVEEHSEFQFIPPMSGDQIKGANFNKTFITPFDQWVPEIDLLHTLEIQRRTPFAGGKFKVGGRAELTTITSAGISQRVVHVWPDDEVGKVVTPKPINWFAWREEQLRKRSNIDFSSLSRLQRERLEKKAKKGTLRTA